jgi:hypothetical protein
VKCREIKRKKKRFAWEGERGEEDEESAIFEEARMGLPNSVTV